MQVDTFNDVQQQFGDVVCPGYNPSYNTSLPSLPTSSPLPWSQGLSSDADFYGHGMAVCSSSESLTLCNPMDPNSYSPQDSFSSSSSSCYDSPTRMESSYHSFPSDPYHHQQLYNPHQNYMSSCQQESLSGPEYTPYYNTSDYPSAYPVMESYRKDFPGSPEMCYNVL
nr:colorectal cancer associated 2 [Nothobranchius furzeri]XP_054598890.1 colorectal cancer associated 2 [Nothobranchius furzeri]